MIVIEDQPLLEVNGETMMLNHIKSQAKNQCGSGRFEGAYWICGHQGNSCHQLSIVVKVLLLSHDSQYSNCISVQQYQESSY